MPEAGTESTATIVVERRGEVLIVTLDRPNVRNAVDSATARRLARSSSSSITMTRSPLRSCPVPTASAGHGRAGSFDDL